MSNKRTGDRVQLTSQFVEFENHYDMFSRSIDGFYYWHLLRKWVFDVVCTQSRDFEFGGHPDFHAQFKKSNVLKHCFKLGTQVIKSYKGLRGSLIKNSQVIFLGNWKKSGGVPTARNIFIDGIIEELSLKSIVLERPNQLLHKTDNYSDVTVFSDYIEFKWLIALKTGRWGHEAQRVLCDLLPLISSLEKWFGVSIYKSSLKQRIDYITNGYYEIKKSVSKLVSNNSIKCIVEIEHYCVFCLICNKVFHEYGIPVIEVQHGQIGSGHVAYNLTSNSTKMYLPDIVATFGQYWIDECGYPLKEKRMVPVGSIPLEHDVMKFSKTRDNEHHVILVISQGQDGGTLSKLTCDLVKILDLSRYKIVYKLHPSEFKSWQSIHPDLVEIQDQISIASNECELGYYINESTAVVGISSTVLFEAIAYQKNVFIVNAIDSEIAKPLIDRGLALSVSSASELVNQMTRIDYIVKKNDAEYIWKSSAINNMSTLIYNAAQGSNEKIKFGVNEANDKIKGERL